MSTQFRISVTKEIIAHCKDCHKDRYAVEKNCAIALALSDIFPSVYVTNYSIYPFGIDSEKEKRIKIPLPLIAQQFIKLFDGFHLIPNLRLLLPEFEFTIEIPDEAIDHVNIDDALEPLATHGVAVV